MKKVLNFLKNWFEHNGLIKLLAAFAILVISVILGRKFQGLERICTWTAVISFGYLLLTLLLFTVAGIINTIKDNEKSNIKE